ncbi:MAG: hypothetical protein WCJ18_05835 [Planctomycetota bacterium]
MRRSVALFGLAFAIGLAMTDEAFARRHARGRRGGGGFGGTAASAAMMGYAAIMRAQGAANLQNSQAAINWEKAKTAEIQNRLRWTETYFKMRQVNHDMQLAERGPAMTTEEAAKLAHDALPKPLANTELDQPTGRITYPEALRDSLYDGLREDVDAFFRRRAAVHGSVDFNDLQHVETILDLFHGELRSNLPSYAAGDYGTAATFLERLRYEATRPVR